MNTIEQLRQQLAASQAREQQLREVLGLNVVRNPKYPWKPAKNWDNCPACFERFDLDKCEHCGSGYDDEYIHVKGSTDTSALDQIKAGYEAQIQQLREALQALWDNPRGNLGEWIVVEQALALPQDTSALQAIVAKAGEAVRKQCVYTINTQKNPVQTSYATGLVFDPANNMVDKCAGVIRSLPAISLEDLK